MFPLLSVCNSCSAQFNPPNHRVSRFPRSKLLPFFDGHSGSMLLDLICGVRQCEPGIGLFWFWSVVTQGIQVMYDLWRKGSKSWQVFTGALDPILM